MTPVFRYLIVATIASSATPDVTVEAAERSLKAAVDGRFKIGVAISPKVFQNSKDVGLIRRHFEILTPENCMKPQAVQPAEGVFKFDRSDLIADFARENDLEIVGHCLVWAKDDRTDEWMTLEENGPVSRERLLARITDHIEAVVPRYRDVATQWDVVNEAIGGGEDLLRDSVYARTTGFDFLETAFAAAREHDPDALLVYNDYNAHLPGRLEKVIAFLTELKERDVPVDAYGMQGHFQLGEDPRPQLKILFDELRRLGLKVVISELDIDVVRRGRWWADGGRHRDELRRYDPYPDRLPDDVAEDLAAEYARLFRFFDEHRDVIVRVSFWNLHDGHSWLNSFPWRRTNHPLLFDRTGEPKQAFDRVFETLTTTSSS
ncbi:MAG: endo-1,4-beta-xylanase [Planctomycetota bacterium]